MRRLLWISLAALGVALVTVVIFLIRAGDPGGTNWPVTFELRSSDNGVLFQFAQDVFAGRALDWSFSPQVFVFPEIPISLVAYLVAGGTVQLYYLVVAAINSTLLFLGLFVILGHLRPSESLARQLVRGWIAMFPLLLLPLVGSTWLFEYPDAPTYYFGMYLMILVVPALFFDARLGARIALGLGIALTAASDPLALVFTVPALACVLLVRVAVGGLRSVSRPAAWGAGVLLVAAVVRLALFGRLQGASPLSYVSTAVFSGRIDAIRSYLRAQFGDPAVAPALFLGGTLLVAGLVVAIVVAVQMIRGRLADQALPAAALYYALVPVTGLAGTIVLIITDYLYLWPVLVLPLTLVLLPLPRRWIPWAAGLAALGLIGTGVATGAVPNLAQTSTYFNYRSAETRCLDEKLPPGITVGYATFSDARRIELTSHRGIRLIQLKSSGIIAPWLTNLDYARDNVGRFFYINDHGDEPPINVGYLERAFGRPDSSFSCGPGETVLLYTAPSQVAEIKARYAAPTAR